MQERKLQDLNIVETAVANPDLFSTLVGFVEAAGLVTTLSGTGPFTVFAPTNDAFAAVPAEIVAALTANTTLLAQVLTYHVVPGTILSTDLTEGAQVATVEGSTVEVASLDPVMINDATVITADIAATNGVIHVIDKVLIPPTLTLDPPATMSPPSTGPVVTETPPSTGNTIVDLAASTPELSTLASLLGQAGFIEALSGPGPFTVFAPTNKAFNSMYGPIRNYIIRTPLLLADVLTYHVVAGSSIFSTDLQLGATAETLEGRSVTVTSLDPVMINRAMVTTADIEASNGVIHIIDAVMIPPAR